MTSLVERNSGSPLANAQIKHGPSCVRRRYASRSNASRGLTLLRTKIGSASYAGSVRALLQRVARAHVEVDGTIVGQIGSGWLVLLGVGHGDTSAIADQLAEKVALLRCFEDANGKTNLSIADIGGEVLVVSQFTLYADVSRGRRPGFTNAAPPEQANTLVEYFADALQRRGLNVAQGQFGAHMQVSLVNDGPFTIWLDSAPPAGA
jgi:D-tyrosyl-tRNA(Tyr) deacylase